MIQKLYLLLTVCLISTIAFTQTKPAKDWQKKNLLIVDEQTKQTTLVTAVNENGYIQVSKLPDQIDVIINEKPDTIKILFNEGDKLFTLAFNCSKDDKNCQGLKLTDIENSRVKLYFLKGSLVRIGNRFLEKPLDAEQTNPKIQITYTGSTEKPVTATSETNKFPKTDKKQLPLSIPIKDSLIAIEECLLCNFQLPPCEDKTKPCLTEGKINNQTNEYRDKKLKDKPVYEVSIRDNNVKWKIVYPDKTVYDINNTSILKAENGSTIIIKYVTDDTVNVAITADGETNFMDPINAVQNPYSSSSSSGSTVNIAGTTEKNNTVNNLATVLAAYPSSRQFDTLLNQNEFKLETASNVKKMAGYIILMNDSVTNTPEAFKKFYMDSVKSKNTLFNDYLTKNPSRIFEMLINSINSFKNENYTKDSLIKFAADTARFWRDRFLALDIILEKFNSDLAAGNFLANEKEEKLIQIELGIKTCLGISVDRSKPASLREELTRVINVHVDPSYYSVFEGLVTNIDSAYQTLLKRKSTKVLRTKSFTVPDADRFKLTIKDIKSSAVLFGPQTIRVKGGYKIDFSSGIFLSGIRTPEFILTNSLFKYRETKDTVVTLPGGIPKDSIMYTGNINTVSGSLIRQNKSRLNYGIGFFIHGYKRSGGAINWGPCIGGVLNTNGQANVLLGMSVLMAAGNNRIALSFGAIAGKEKKLSASAEPYAYNSSYVPYENGATLYNGIREVPQFFVGNSNEIQTYQPWMISYFVGLSVNIASISVKN